MAKSIVKGKIKEAVTESSVEKSTSRVGRVRSLEERISVLKDGEY